MAVTWWCLLLAKPSEILSYLLLTVALKGGARILAFKKRTWRLRLRNSALLREGGGSRLRLPKLWGISPLPHSEFSMLVIPVVPRGHPRWPQQPVGPPGLTTHVCTAEFRWGKRQWHPTPVLLPGKSQGRGSLVGCCLWGRTESDTTEAT